jgi:solute:Na+ symporter, SSS family
MILPLFIGLIAFLGGASLWLGRSGKQSQTSQDFFTMGRKLGLFGLIMTLLATQIGGGALLGASEEAYTRGWSVLFYPLGMVLGLIVLGLGYGAKMRKLNLTTVPEIFEKIYRSAHLRKIASLLSIASLFLILVGQGIAARKFFMSLGFHGDFLFIAFWSILIAYTVMGGLSAAVKTDILQASFIIVTLAFAALAVTQGQFSPQPISVQGASSDTPWLSWLLLPLLFMLIEQDMGQWCFAAKNPRTVSLAALTAAFVLMAVALIPIFFGTMAAKQGVVIEQGSSVLITAVEALTNPIVATFVICAVLMAIISTANSLLCSVSSNIACDFPKLGKSIAASRAITLGVGIATLMLAFAFDNVVAVLMFSYELAVCVLFVPVTMAIWKKEPLKRSATLSMIAGATSFILFKIVACPLPKELVSLSASFCAFSLSEMCGSIKRQVHKQF